MNFLLFIILCLLFLIFQKIVNIEKTLKEIKKSLLPVDDSLFLEFYTTINGQLTKVEKMFLKVSDKLPLSLEVKDKFGNAAQVDGKPLWALSDESLATLEVDENGLSATLLPKGTVGSFKVQVSADADLGEGKKDILGELQIDLLPGEATVLEIKAGEALPQ